MSLTTVDGNGKTCTEVQDYEKAFSVSHSPLPPPSSPEEKQKEEIMEYE